MRGKINPFTSSEFALLGVLYQTPTHGYDLHRMIIDPEGIGLIWQLKMSNLYAYLDKLEKKGFITGVIHPGETHPTRTEYQITPTGRTAFEEWATSPVIHPRDFRQEFMARYHFLLKYFPEKVNTYLEKQLAECQSWVEKSQQNFDNKEGLTDFSRSVLKFRVIQTEAILQWLSWAKEKSARKAG